ncbi:sulfatase-like hydrolase/transferase [Halomarina rubra]|uniref:Sulfatase-like hydrolase/transferase n=1 Tax=Halomarina rubra TaxID=2071873 RepID=A0ABD6AVL9_9EURY|nr:sulfatase-like hydrolase/transferase [Halomarina rubra]
MTDSQSSPPNLLFVCVDCLRNDAVVDGWGETPFLDSLRADGRVYTDLFATATTTTPCVAGLMTGQYSEHNGVTSLREARLNAETTTLAERLSAAGYDTCAMVTGPLVEETDLDRGFDAYHYREKEASLFGPWERTAGERLDELDDPFFCYLHLWELHEPISVPEGYDERRYGRWPYERALSALDARLEALVERLPDDTVVALHGDHGESVTWRGHPAHEAAKTLRDKLRYERGVDTRRVERAVNRVVDRLVPAGVPDHFLEAGHGETVYDTTANVPFVLSGPGVDAGTESGVCRQVDVAPTLCDLLGVPLDESTVDGASLLGGFDDRTAYIRACGAALRGHENWQRAVRTCEEKYVEYPARDWSPDLYDLDRDRDERRPLGEAAADRRRAMRRQFPRLDAVDSERLDIDERLHDLGYL